MSALEELWLKHYDEGVPRHAAYPEEPLPSILHRNVQKWAHKPITNFYGAVLTYGDLWRQISRMAEALSRLGVKKGDRVAIMLPNCPQYVVSYYATLWLGAVVVNTNPMYVEREIEHQWSDAGVKVAVVLDHLFPRVEKVYSKIGVEYVIVTSFRDALPRHLALLYPLKARKQKLFTAVPYSDRVLPYGKLLKSNPPTEVQCPATLDDIALLQYTGGTTGISKGVILTHRNIMANVVQITKWFPDLEWARERIVCILPFFHVFGMTACMNWALYTGSYMLLIPRFEINEFLKLLHKFRPTIFPGVPTIYVAIVNHPDIKKFDLSSVKFCITGSAPMPVEVINRFEKMTGSIIVEGFGLTESSPVTHCNPLHGLRKPGSVGIPVSDTECKIVDIETGERELPIGEEGELVVRGPQVMKGYWNKPEETAQALRNGWLYTGDIAKMDEDGYTYIVDRKKDMIIAGGYNIYPREIDEVLYSHPKVLDAVTVGVPDPYRGETVKVFVVPKPGETLTPEEVISFCRERLAAYKVPKLVEIRESLPKSAVGKVLRKELREEELRKQKQAS
ncbi:long-chain-fatty-acid--CoA ligase [Thermodesulforhabdus norvegica]|uniref:Long-chain acyl-CoA synthetase n=1 Tax=Thermodesulforhabdus norvegica TaxID=39841 RepID=A0A1I4UM56_9BACT|nr:long-chain fatty acid--CoA ligase [Thermodesulforhabdus norvegica]SFM90056.1 long-chain acyl-CoA synthetase [Thermodesulforhabdus norvegica]